MPFGYGSSKNLSRLQLAVIRNTSKTDGIGQEHIIIPADGPLTGGQTDIRAVCVSTAVMQHIPPSLPSSPPLCEKKRPRRKSLA